MSEQSFTTGEGQADSRNHSRIADEARLAGRAR